jgi:hypothetical protein
VLTFWRSPPIAASFVKTVIGETLDHGGSFGGRQNGDRGAPFVRNDQWRQRKSECNRGLIVPTLQGHDVMKSRCSHTPVLILGDCLASLSRCFCRAILQSKQTTWRFIMLR